MASLFGLFDSIQRKWKQIESYHGSSSDPQFQSIVSDCLSDVKQAVALIDSNGIFSSNEELDDVSTTSLRYLMADFYLMELLGKLTEKDHNKRLENIKQSKEAAKNFMKRAKQLKLVDPSDLSALSREGPPSPKTKREEKISRFKREKQTSSKLQELLQSKEGKRKKIDSGMIGTKDKEELTEDEEELERDIYKNLISLSVTKTIEEMQSLDEEIGMLQHMQKLNFKIPEVKDEPKKPKIENVVILPNKRQEIQNQIFRPSHTLPTMTLEEWADHIEKQNHDIQKNAPPPTKEQLEREKRLKAGIPDSEDDSDEKVLKDRAWDDWKDTHGKGEGNKNDHYFRRT